MHIKNDAGYGRCPTCNGRLMSVTGSSNLTCFNCLGSDQPKTGRTIVVTENSTKSPQEDPTAKITVVGKDGTMVDQPAPQTAAPIGKSVTVTLTLEELETGTVGTVLKKIYEALDELPAGTVRETKRVIAIQNEIDRISQQGVA